MLKFKYGSFDDYNNLEVKDPDVLYFIDNHTFYKGDNLISNVRTVEDGFPDTPTEDMRLNYFISLKTGAIKYVTEDLKYIDLTQIQTDYLVITKELAEKIKEALSQYLITVQMPNMSVQENTIYWKESNFDEIKIINFE